MMRLISIWSQIKRLKRLRKSLKKTIVFVRLFLLHTSFFRLLNLPAHVGYGVAQSPLGRQTVCWGPRSPKPGAQLKTACPPTSRDMMVTRRLGGRIPTSPHSIPTFYFAIMNTFALNSEK